MMWVRVPPCPPNKVRTMYEKRYWQVKVYQAKSQSYTSLDMEGMSEDDCRQQLEDAYEDDRSWVFVSATEEC